MTIRINNRGTALERSVINYCGDLNRFFVITAIALGSAVIYKDTSYSVGVNDF